MKLDRLEIFGFKSFADRTLIEFNPGMTAIVGPNGCGKTNVTDAIRWVLGEQRPTALRGSNMQEVIFNGSRARGPLGMAEVTLSFTNALGLIPVEVSEVSVTRRVFRDGETHYLLNRSLCNLKDIRDLFLGTGVGSSAYSLIEQRMVDAILSDKAEERRFLFEEAAGVTRYKARRKATLRKLEATEEDLRRLGDILNEVRKTAGSLRRQLGKARRFEELQRREMRLAVAVARYELADLQAGEGPLRERVRALEEELARGAAESSARDTELERLEGELAGRRREERELRSRLEAGSAGLEALERERVVAEEGRRQAASECDRLAREIADHETAARALVEKRGGLAETVAGARAADAQARGLVERRSAAVEELSARFDAAQRALREARAERERLARERLALEAELVRTRTAREAALARRAEIEVELEAFEGAAIRTGASPLLDDDGEEQRERDGLAGLKGRLAEAQVEHDRRRNSRERSEAELDSLNAEAAELAARRREVAARLDTLEQLKAGFAGFGEGARRALEARAAIAPGLRGPLALEVQVVEPRWTAAVEAYLDLFLDALVTAETREARAVLEFWRERDQAGAVWCVADSPAGGPPALGAVARAELLRRGTDVVTLRGDLDRYREALFGRLLIAESLDRALALRRGLNADGGAGWYVVAALSGEILEPSGMVRLPQRKADGNGAPRFHQAEHLRAALAEVDRQARRLESSRSDLQRQVASALAAEREAHARLAERTSELDDATRAHDRLRDERAARRSRAALLRDELATILERLGGEDGADLTDVRGTALQQALERAESDEGAREAELERLRLERENGLADLSAAELALQRCAADLATHDRELAYLVQAEEREGALAADKSAQLEGLERRQVFLLAESGRLAESIEERRLEVEELRRGLGRIDEAVQALDVEREAREADARRARRAHEEAGSVLHTEEMRLAELLHRRQAIRSIVETEFGRSLEELDELVAPREGDAPLPGEPETLRAALVEVREKKTALGPVNLLALDEYGAEKDRLDFLEAQYADLVRARDQLREGIRRINATARDLFLETFVRARENFRLTFGTLFEGGTADIALADEADPLESAIEISASPRGKRIQTVNLLSGGERALTALALLFAIYLVKPSPFCILDEVDAPLDDANIGRFLRMLKNFSDRTQFIVVTHNKRTMEAADFLYGITMEEPGISTLVSVEFHRRGRHTDEAPDRASGPEMLPDDGGTDFVGDDLADEDALSSPAEQERPARNRPAALVGD